MTSQYVCYPAALKSPSRCPKMPTYGYRCPACGHEDEEFHSIKDEPAIPCPQCGTRMDKLVSSAEFKFRNPRGVFKIENAATPDKQEKFT
jgi:putative FmdB family regulatory protein